MAEDLGQIQIGKKPGVESAWLILMTDEQDGELLPFYHKIQSIHFSHLNALKELKRLFVFFESMDEYRTYWSEESVSVGEFVRITEGRSLLGDFEAKFWIQQLSKR